jgi:hypothetical protein
MSSTVKDAIGNKEKKEWVKNPNGLKEIYGNYIHANWSLFDTRILIGHLKPDVGDSDKYVIEEQGALTLAWAQTKNLARLLNEMVEAYESVNGVIPKLNIAPNAAERKALAEQKKN